jgi:hypothetical protein
LLDDVNALYWWVDIITPPGLRPDPSRRKIWHDAFIVRRGVETREIQNGSTAFTPVSHDIPTVLNDREQERVYCLVYDFEDDDFSIIAGEIALLGQAIAGAIPEIKERYTLIGCITISHDGLTQFQAGVDLLDEPHITLGIVEREVERPFANPLTS